jgi:vitamin B12 transporter
MSAVRRIASAFPALIASAAVPAAAQDRLAGPTLLPEIVVSATRNPTPATEVASSVTIITADEIERRQLRTLPDVLRDVPGLNLVQTGGPGGLTSVFMRGTNANHTKVLIDGIDVGDPSSGTGAFDFAHLLTGDVERVEVLRGPQSGLYGSDAIGGVINIITKTGAGPARVTGFVEGGSFGTFNQGVGLSGSQQRFNYALNAAHFRSDDTPVTPPSLLPPGRKNNPNVYDNKSVSTRLGADLTSNLDVGLTARFIESRLSYTADDFSTFPSTLNANQNYADNRELFTRATAHLSLFDGKFDQTVGLGYTDYRRRDVGPDGSFTPATPNFYRGDRVKLDWLGNITVMDGQVLTLGAETQADTIDNTTKATNNNNAGFVQLQSKFGERVFSTLSLRHDDNERFGGKTTYRVAPALAVPETGMKFLGSVGTGFKAPSLDQLFTNFPSFNFFANPNLQPEESFGYDAGFEQAVFDKRVRFGATYFHNDIDNLIITNDSGTSYANVAKAETFGAESFIAWKPLDRLSLRADYTYTIARDDVLDRPLLRRPKHKASLTAGLQASEALNLSATVLYVGPRVDGNRDFSIQRQKGDGYALVNLAGAYDVGNGVTFFGRVENLFDREYEDPNGFLRPGFGAFAGVRVAFDAVRLVP